MPGQSMELTLEMINRSKRAVKLLSVEYLPLNMDTVSNQELVSNELVKYFKTIQLPEDLPLTNPYWLNKSYGLGMYTVEEQLMRGLPETPRSLKVKFNMEIASQKISFTKDIVFKKNDPVDGEVYQPLEIIQPVSGNIEEKVYVLAGESPKMINVLIKSAKENVKGNVTLAHPNGWKIEPQYIDVDLKLKGEEMTASFMLYPPKEQSEGKITPIIKIGERHYTKEMVTIEYDHIPTQTVQRPSESKVVKIDLERRGQNIAYIMGAGDEIPTNLEQIGYNVTVLEDKDINLNNLQKFDAVITGVRAYNTNARMKFHQAKLMEYVEKGGTMIVQYNTAHRLVTTDLAPYPIKLSRDRVTVEEAEVRFLEPDHEVLNFPNKITSKDFDGWVQERGLYFPNEWDDKFKAILSANDPGETPKNGGLLVAEYGKGHYIYSGYSWFRELPAGVPGAYRLFTNLISIGKKERP